MHSLSQNFEFNPLVSLEKLRAAEDLGSNPLALSPFYLRRPDEKASNIFGFVDKPLGDETKFTHTILSLFYQREALEKKIKERAVKAGKAAKADALQLLIYELVEANPDISAKELLKILNSGDEDANCDGIILSIGDNYIEFENGKKKSGLINFKKAKVSGLKDRLSRAKKLFAQSQIAR